MAITKWIPAFGAAPSTATSTLPPPEDKIPVVSTADAKQFGLENFGNTCYANSVLQALYFCAPFRDLVVQYPDPSVPDIDLSSLPPLQLPPTSPPPAHARPKPSRKGSLSENIFSSQHASSSCATPARPLPIGLPIPSTPPTLLSALRSLYMHISKNPADKGTVAPRAFIDKLKELNELFRSTMHQDAHEFLNFLLNQIVEEMDEDRKKLQNGNGNGSGTPNGTPGEDLSASIGTLPSVTAPSIPTFIKDTLVHQLFEGVLTSETRCLTCETVSSRDESFLDLSIDIEQNSSVTACLRQFSASEMLCQRNKFFCDSCCDLQEAEKRMKIKKLPNVLALHLKRFKYQEDVGRYIKLAYRVAFPLELRLFNTVDDAQNPDRLYELFAIVVHIGNGPHHGHYVSVVKARGTWYLFDDDNVEVIKESDIPKYFGDSNAGAAYVLYYQAVDLDRSALGLQVPESAKDSNVAVDSGASQATTLATTLESDELLTPSPALPPGLTPQVVQDGTSPSPSPPMFTSPFATSSPQPILQPQPSLSVDIPVPSSSADIANSSPTVASTPSAANGKGFFNSIRHSPSISLRKRPSTSNGSESRKGVVDVPPVPPIPIPSGSKSATVENSSSLPASSAMPSPISQSFTASPMSPPSNGKDKEKSSGNWIFKRRSRSEKPPPSSSSYLAERSTSLGSGALEDGSTPWYKPQKSVSRRASEAGLVSAPASSTPVSASVPAHSSLAIPHSRTMSPVLRPVPEGKKSNPELPASAEKAEKAEKRPTRRPSTAGAAIERPRSSITTPVPPMPSPSAPPSSFPNPSPERTPPPNGTAHHAPARPHTSHAAHAPSALGYSASNGTTSTLGGESASTASASSTGATKAKRATRKLSFTAPMLGFGRREKDKDRERRPQTPTAASYAASSR